MTSTHKGTILLVEDEVPFRRVFEDALMYDGYNVLAAGDGESGWQLAKSQKPDLILLDLVLPKLHGFEVLRNVRADATTKDTPVIVVTVLGEQEDIRKGLELGANDYIVKGSYSPSEILIKIRLELHLKLKIRVQILLIETDEVLRAELGLALEEAGFKVAVAANALAGLNKLYESRPDVVIMAEDLQGVKGEELCSRVRQISYLPIIVLGSDEEVAGEMLEVGADAYMTRPPNTAELIARVHSLLRRRRRPNHDPPVEDSTRRGDNPGHDLKGGSAEQGNSSTNLTQTEFRLLSCLMLNRGRVMTYLQLIAEVWGGKRVSRDCLKFYVRRLKQKLGSDVILNHRGIGYRFSGE